MNLMIFSDDDLAFTLFSLFWLINKTGLMLNYKTDNELVDLWCHPSEYTLLKGQVTEPMKPAMCKDIESRFTWPAVLFGNNKPSTLSERCVGIPYVMFSFVSVSGFECATNGLPSLCLEKYIPSKSFSRNDTKRLLLKSGLTISCIDPTGIKGEAGYNSCFGAFSLHLYLTAYEAISSSEYIFKRSPRRSSVAKIFPAAFISG
uniref:Uncharacterized protein n=1 Tax=Glossina austeni TaxID=7395 RepID=A0A1A9VUY7_GLOAU